jgi:phage protein D
MADDDRFEDARPTVAVDGKDSDDLRLGMLSAVIAEDTQGLYRCEASIGNLGGDDPNGVDFRYFDRKTFDFGKSFRVKLKDDVLFEGRITGLEARFPPKSPPELVILAEDALQDLRMTRRTRTFVDQTDADVFNKIADDHQMGKSVTLSGGSHKVLAQVNQSDLAFLRDRARAIEAELWVSLDSSGKPTLNAKTRADRGGGAPIKLGYRNELTEFCVVADLAGQRTEVAASGWDVSAKDKVTFSATDSDLGGELGDFESGASILKAKLGDRKESIVHGVPFTQQEAQERAQAHFKMQARRFVTGYGVAKTNGKLRVGAIVDIDGVGPLFNGKYYLAEVRHLFDGTRGLRSELSVERAGLGRPS